MTALSNQPTGTAENMADRRVRALELRKGGASYRQIAQALGVEVATAHGDVKSALADLAALEKELAEDVRQLEIERLDVAVLAISKKVKAGDLGAIDRWLRISESRRKLLGIDAPTKTDVGAGGWIALARLADQGPSAADPSPGPV